jgi:hypothetical protein
MKGGKDMFDFTEIKNDEILNAFEKRILICVLTVLTPIYILEAVWKNFKETVKETFERQ